MKCCFTNTRALHECMRISTRDQAIYKMTLLPKESGKLIANSSKYVKINNAGVEKLGDKIAEEIKSGNLSSKNFKQTEVHPTGKEKWAIDWLFVVDSLNFCFWKPEDETGWKVNGYTGYFALCAAINRAMEEKIQILDPKFYSVISEKELGNILRSDTKVKVPLLTERVKCLQEVGSVLLEKFDGSFENVVKSSNNSAMKLLETIVKNFKCFKDEAVYKNNEVSFYKRAQILIGDIWACYQGKNLGYFKDIEEITMFADYRVPQSMLYYGVLEYNNELLDSLEQNEILLNGSEKEVEIRGCSIHGVELVKEYVKKKLNEEEVNSVLIDHYLWDFRRKNAKQIQETMPQFHKTYCIYY